MYKNEIQKLIDNLPFEIDLDVNIGAKIPTTANSEFLTNKEQGDWAEKIVLKAINENSSDYFAVEYGHSDSISAGDPGFIDFYHEYIKELNTIGKKPDVLIFKIVDFPNRDIDLTDIEIVKKAVAALEIRSSSFLHKKYNEFAFERQNTAIKECEKLCKEILQEPYSSLLSTKNQTIFNLLINANVDTFRNVDFRQPSWSATSELRELSELLKRLKYNIRILHKRDYLSITPKMEDVALVNRWIQNFNVKHFYLQVFFDKAYVISLKDILKLVSDHENEEKLFSIEKDSKNQQKTTIKVNVATGKEIIGTIDMPDHKSMMKELERGRLLYYVTFDGGKGYLDNDIFQREIIYA